MKTLKQMMIVLLLMMLSFGHGWAATYYIIKDPLNAGKVRYLASTPPAADGSNGTGNVDIDAVYALGNTNTIVVAAGTYATTEIDAADGMDIGQPNNTMRAFLPTDPGYSTWGGEVYLSGTGIANNLININTNTAGTVLSHINLINPVNTFDLLNGAGGTASTTLNDSYVQGALRVGAATLTLNRCKVADSARAPFDMVTSGGTLNLNYCLFTNHTGECRMLNGTLNANHTVFTGFNARVLALGNTATAANLTNCVVSGNVLAAAAESSARPLDNTSTGTMTATNCILLPNQRLPDSYTWTGLTDGGGNIYSYPKFQSGRYPGILCLTIDDSGNRLLWNKVALYATSKGIKVNLAVYTNAAIADADADDAKTVGWESLRARVAEGHFIASHSTDTDNVSTKSAGDLATALSTSKSIIETKIGNGYECSVFLYPGGVYGDDAETRATVITAVQAAGYKGARAGFTIGYPNRHLNNIAVYNLPTVSVVTGVGTTNIKRNISSILAAALEAGEIWTVVGHGDGGVDGDDNADGEDYLLQNWKDLIDAIVDIGAAGYVKTLAEAVDYIRAGTYVDGLSWTRTFTDGSNYRVQSTAPGINTGKIITGVNDIGNPDYFGKYLYRLPNIGIDEGAGIPKRAGFLTIP